MTFCLFVGPLNVLRTQLETSPMVNNGRLGLLLTRPERPSSLQTYRHQNLSLRASQKAIFPPVVDSKYLVPLDGQHRSRSERLRFRLLFPMENIPHAPQV